MFAADESEGRIELERSYYNLEKNEGELKLARGTVCLRTFVKFVTRIGMKLL